MTEKIMSSSKFLEQLATNQASFITVGDLVADYREAGFAVLLIMFSSPLALPLPAIGLAQVLAIPLLLLSIQLALGRDTLYLPESIAQKKIRMSDLIRLLNKVIPVLQKLEYLFKPRLLFLSSPLATRVIGLLCFICAIAVMAPFPGSNSIPSAGILFMSLGLLEHDGVAIFSGVVVGSIGTAIALSVLYFGAGAFAFLIQ